MSVEVGTAIRRRDGGNKDLDAGCGGDCKEPKALYTFYYGRKLPEVRDTGETGTPRFPYQVAGTYEMVLCRACVHTHHRRRLLQMGMLTLVLLVLAVAGVAFSGVSPLLGILAFISFLASLLCSGAFLGMLIRKEQIRGEELAIALKSAELQAQGYTLFWHSSDYALLQHKR